MGESIRIECKGIGEVSGWLAIPKNKSQAALVVVQEIFGLNTHMRDVTDRYANQGFFALTPAMFDPVQPGVELGYDEAGFKRGRELTSALGLDRAVAIVAAAADRLRHEGASVVGVVGFCWGGTVAYLANTRLGLPAVSYYGARTVPFLDEHLRAPMMFHFGEQDPSIPATDIAAHQTKHPQAAVHIYPAGHAFNRDVDPKAYKPESAQLANRRTLAFFEQALGTRT